MKNNCPVHLDGVENIPMSDFPAYPDRVQAALTGIVKALACHADREDFREATSEQGVRCSTDRPSDSVEMSS